MGKIKDIFLNEIMGGNMIRAFDPRPAGQGRIPISPNFSSGAPSMDPSVQISKKQQTIMTPEDREYWEKASFDPPFDLNKEKIGDLDVDLNGIQKENKMNIIMLKDFIKKFIKESSLVDEDDVQDKEKPEMDEFSAIGGAGGGAIRGHMGGPSMGKPVLKSKKKLGQR